MPTFHEIDPSPVLETYENSKGVTHVRSTRTFVCDFTECAAMLAYFYSEAGSTLPGFPLCLVRRVKFRGRGQIGGTATLSTYQEAIIEVFYSTEGPTWVNGLYIEESMTTEYHRICPVGSGLKFSDGTDLKPEDYVGVELMIPVHVVSGQRLTTAPTDALTYTGKINSSTKSCLILPYTFGPQTVLFCPGSVKADFQYSTGVKYSVVYRHMINAFGWNKFWNPHTGSFETLKTASGSNYVKYTVGW